MRRDVPIKVSDFMGISRRVLSEDLPNPYFETTQNLWERKFGELQPRGGSAAVPITFPSNILSIDNGFIIKQKGGIKRRVVAARCSQPSGASIAANLNACVTLAKTTATGGKWNTAITGGVKLGAGTANAPNDNFFIQAIGYGIQHTVAYNLTAGGYDTIQVTVTSGLDANITGLNLYVRSDEQLSGGGVNGSSYTWFGYIDLTATPTGTFSFTQAPLTTTTPVPAATTYGIANPTFSLSESSTPGSLVVGKTYYVAVLSNFLTNTTFLRAGSCYRTKIASVSSITMKSGTSIAISNIVGDTSCYMVAIGEHPQLLQPQFITNSITTNTVTSLFASNPNVVDLTPFDASTTDFVFRQSDISIMDTLVGFDEAGAIKPVFVARNSNANTAVYSGTDIAAGSGNIFNQADVNRCGDGSRYCFAQYGELGYFVNNYENPVPSPFLPTLFPKTGLANSNLMQTDGRVAALCVFDFGTTAPPRSAYIAFFQESAVIGGWTKASAAQDAYNRIFFSDAFNPYNFAQGGSGAALAFVQIESGGEPVTGIGVYSVTTADAGPKTELMVGKTNATWKLNSLPTDFSNANYLETMSARVGIASHFTIANTDVGTLFCSLDNVYVMRDTGEPTPIGDDISFILKPEDPSIGVNPSYWNAVFHDGHYKLSYSVNNQAQPTQELWLSIPKMKANKQLPAWYGPHTGRTISYSLRDAFFTPGDRERRLCFDVANKRVFFADRDDVRTDFGSNYNCMLETKDHTGKDGLYDDKLLTEFFVKGKFDETIDFTKTILSNQAIAEVGTISCLAPPNWSGGTYSSFLACPTYARAFFPENRIRGRTMRFRLSYLGARYFSISGLVLFFKPERRRIGS